MKSTAGHRRNSRPRFGLTWIDVVVTMLILLVLAALLLPAGGRITRSARRAECQNNMKQLCTAVMNHASKKNGKLPSLTVSDESGINSNWLVDLLPHLDNAEAHQHWESLTSDERVDFEISLKPFQCPKDPTSFQVAGGLSYVANSGYGIFRVDSQTNAIYEDYPHGHGSVDWDGDGVASNEDRAKTIATGVFWPKREGDTFKSSLDYISAGDGQTNTFLFAESLNAGKWNSAKTLDIAFVAGLDRILFEDPTSLPNCLNIAGADLGPFGVAGGNVPRHTPSPSSNHLGVSIYGFADGAARQISDKINPTVYLRLMTPNGQRYGQSPNGLENY